MVIAIAKYFGLPSTKNSSGDSVPVRGNEGAGVLRGSPKVLISTVTSTAWKLVKAIYGLKQASRVCERDLRRVRVLHRLSSIGVRPCPSRQDRLTVTACSCWSTWMTC
ncbi:hypothetical protein Pcac1_g29544 [Phytophthora cactorum]|nr:hypothetical protein Pcac1_g29544 [Phytophthora cactorum]